MATIASTATAKLLQLLTASSGAALQLMKIAQKENLTLAPFARILKQQVPFDLAEKTAGASYPALYVFCQKLENTLREKFRTFSGRAHLAIEVRVSHDRLEALTRELELYAAAVTAVLDANRGTWAEGYFYTGGYEVEFGAVKHGGKNFIQAAKISVIVEASVD